MSKFNNWSKEFPLDNNNDFKNIDILEKFKTNTPTDLNILVDALTKQTEKLQNRIYLRMDF